MTNTALTIDTIMTATSPAANQGDSPRRRKLATGEPNMIARNKDISRGCSSGDAKRAPAMITTTLATSSVVFATLLSLCVSSLDDILLTAFSGPGGQAPIGRKIIDPGVNVDTGNFQQALALELGADALADQVNQILQLALVRCFDALKAGRSVVAIRVDAIQEQNMLVNVVVKAAAETLVDRINTEAWRRAREEGEPRL